MFTAIYLIAIVAAAERKVDLIIAATYHIYHTPNSWCQKLISAYLREGRYA